MLKCVFGTRVGYNEVEIRSWGGFLAEALSTYTNLEFAELLFLSISSHQLSSVSKIL